MRTYLLLSFMLISGCSIFEPAAHNSTVYRKVNIEDGEVDGTKKINSLVIDAYQRVLVNRLKTDHKWQAGADRADKVVTCAEPSPDAMSAIAFALSASVQAATTKAEKLEAQAGLANSLSQTSSQMQRSLTLQLLRDKMFNACLAYANGAISRYQYHQLLSSTGDASIVLMAVEGLLPMANGENKISAPPVSAGTIATKENEPAKNPVAEAPATPPAAEGDKGNGTSADAPDSNRNVGSSLVVAPKPDIALAGFISSKNINPSNIHFASAKPASGAKTAKDVEVKKTNLASNSVAQFQAKTTPENGPLNGKVAALDSQGPSSNVVGTVQYIVSRYLLNNLVHECLQFYIENGVPEKLSDELAKKQSDYERSPIQWGGIIIAAKFWLKR